MGIDDPMEKIIASALSGAGQTYVREGQVKAANQTLDFFLPEHGVYIEVKQFHSPRIADQMTRAPNIIVAQGRPAVELLAEMIRCWGNAR